MIEKDTMQLWIDKHLYEKLRKKAVQEKRSIKQQAEFSLEKDLQETK